MPEEMPTPKKSLKELERQKKQIENKDKKKLEEMKWKIFKCNYCKNHAARASAHAPDAANISGM